MTVKHQRRPASVPTAWYSRTSGSANAYTVTGGPISGTGFLSVTNGGMVTLANSGNTYTGITYLASGSVLQANTRLDRQPTAT